MTDDSQQETNLQSETPSTQLFFEQNQQEDFELIIDFDDYSN